MKEKLTKVLETIGIVLILGFGFWVLSLGFRFIWEAVKVIFK
jgi:hypothetical protein